MVRGRIIAILAVLTVLAATAYADYKADLVIKSGATTRTGKVFLKGDKSRIELPDSIVIKRPDKGVVWVLMPGKKTYLEMPNKETGRRVAAYDKMPGLKRLGTETVSGYPCNKYQVVTKGKAPATVTIWVSDKLNMEMRMTNQSQAGTMSMEMQNVKRTFLFGKTFEIPKGYTKAPPPTQVPMRK